MRGLANRQAPTEPTPRRTWGIPLRLNEVFPDAAPARQERQGGSDGAGVVLAAIVGTPADRRAPRESGEV